MEGFLIRGWELIQPWCGETSASARGATLAACWLHEPHPISNRLVGLGFPHPARWYRRGGGGIDAGDLHFRPRVVGVVEIWKGFYPGMSTYPLRVRRDFDVVPRSHSRRALAP